MDLDSLFLTTPIIGPKKEPLNLEMHLKMLLLSQGLDSPNPKQGCRVETVHCFVKC